MRVKALEQFQVSRSRMGERVQLTHAPHCGFRTMFPEKPSHAVSLARIVREAREHLKTCRPE